MKIIAEAHPPEFKDSSKHHAHKHVWTYIYVTGLSDAIIAKANS